MTITLALLAAAGWLLAISALHSVGRMHHETRDAIDVAQAWSRQADTTVEQLCRANEEIQLWQREVRRLREARREEQQQKIMCQRQLFTVSDN